MTAVSKAVSGLLLSAEQDDGIARVATDVSTTVTVDIEIRGPRAIMVCAATV